MDLDGETRLERTSSQTSSISNMSRRSETVRIRPKKVPSSGPPTAASEKSLISFPSLSPDNSPKDPRLDTPNNVHLPESAFHHQTPLTAPTVSTLVVSTPSTRPRTALFDDTPLSEHLVPGTLHHTTDEHIERLAAKHGAVALIRQLAEDLAQRDAQMSALQRRAEEREKTLRKMLRDCEVSNMDIEARLRRITVGENAAGKRPVLEGGGAKARKGTADEDTRASSGNGSIIDELVNQAMADPVGEDEGHDPSPSNLTRTAQRALGPATVKAAASPHQPDDYARFMSSAHGHEGRQRGASRGWMDYLWGTTGTSRKSSRASSILSDFEEDGSATARPRVVSGPAPRRKGLQSDLFRPPDDAPGGGSVPGEADEGKGQGSHSRKSSSSVAAWAVKLVAGNSRPASDEPRSTDHQGSTANEPAKHSRRPSTSSGKGGTESAKAALRRINESRFSGPVTRRVTPSLSIGPGGTIKAASQAKFSNAASSPTTSNNNNMAGSPITSGPVELDAILPPDDQPPTLNHTYARYHPTDFLTDRFGFIYDQRRKLGKRETLDDSTVANAESLPKTEPLSLARDTLEVANHEPGESANLVDEPVPSPPGSRSESPASTPEDEGEQKPAKRWQDYLKIATFPTELLSHTPAGGRMSEDPPPDSAAKWNQITVAERGTHLSAGLRPQPSASTIVASHATFARMSTPDAAATTLKKQQQEPVRMLLEQLTELHDSLQRERTIKWNEFLRKVRAERQREGEVAATAGSDGRPVSRLMPEASIADGEIVGVAGLGNKGKIGRAKWKEFKQLVLNGIPVAYRAKIWAECSGASALRTPGYYEDLVKNGVDDPTIVAQIAMDINRTLTDNVFFRDGPGVVKLKEVLLAYSRRNPAIGYCQGMNLIAASLLLITPTAEEAFWLLTSMIENILPAHYYDDSLLASRADQQVLRQYVGQILPRLSAHLDELSIELEALTFQWFLSVFTGCLSAEALFRVWDVVLCTNDGSTFLFQVALALLSLNEKALLECPTAAGVYSYIHQQMTNHAISIDGLIHASEALNKVVTRAEIEDRRARVIQRENER